MSNALATKIRERVLRSLGWEVRQLQPANELHSSRLDYQTRYVEFKFAHARGVLDIGSGADPFPYATVLAERYLGPSVHRTAQFESKGRPVTLCDIQDLPFPDCAFDYVYCSHVLEHVENPAKACSELMRVGKAGYIETPTFGKDILFSQTEEMHKWYVVAIGRKLVFFEYDSRQQKGIESSAWRDIVHSEYRHPLREAFHSHLDLFNVMFEWTESFECIVCYLNGEESRVGC
jgi:SAM-dependent methyltransferase